MAVSFSLEGQVALVTGASRGLGWAFAQALAEAGAEVVLNGRNPAVLEERAGAIAAAGGTASIAAFDVADEAAGTAAIDERGPFLPDRRSSSPRISSPGLPPAPSFTRARQAFLPAIATRALQEPARGTRRTTFLPLFSPSQAVRAAVPSGLEGRSISGGIRAATS